MNGSYMWITEHNQSWRTQYKCTVLMVSVKSIELTTSKEIWMQMTPAMALGGNIRIQKEGMQLKMRRVPACVFAPNHEWHFTRNKQPTYTIHHTSHIIHRDERRRTEQCVANLHRCVHGQTVLCQYRHTENTMDHACRVEVRAVCVCVCVCVCVSVCVRVCVPMWCMCDMWCVCVCVCSVCSRSILILLTPLFLIPLFRNGAGPVCVWYACVGVIVCALGVWCVRGLGYVVCSVRVCLQFVG